MAQNPIRRSQLIAPFGVGAMMVLKGGVSVIACGLDHWYKRESGDQTALNEGEFKVEEYRLQQLLQVNHLRLPPDFRTQRAGEETPNALLKVPFLRFPRWHICSRCNQMQQLTLTTRKAPECGSCRAKGRRGTLQQAAFVALCERGHLQDFPWREWAHGEEKPACQGALFYIASGGSSLAAQRVRCECGKERSLTYIMEAHPDGTTFLSENLMGGEAFFCGGQRPWLGLEEGESCERHLRGALRGALNVWFAQVGSAIYIPPQTAHAPAKLLDLLKTRAVADFISVLGRPTAVQMQQMFALLFSEFKEEQIEKALSLLLDATPAEAAPQASGDGPETAFRRVEFDVLRQPQNESELQSVAAPLEGVEITLPSYFSRLMLIRKLRETRAFGGFTRIYAESSAPLSERKRMLRRDLLPAAQDWLPASVVYGEGIFLELDEQRLRAWETQNANALHQHLAHLRENYERARTARNLQPKRLTPRFILLHTLAHLLINRLTFECGYSSASLRERLYVSDNPAAPMAGLLIYTAEGDAEGTMGGLVRMGQPRYFAPILRRALEAASWCSADPVCLEMGAQHGQGPDSCNLAACHSCALLPETACEEFNRFLDRTLLIDTFANSRFGFFSPLVAA